MATTIKFDAVWDDEAKVYVATSATHHITTEAPTRDALQSRLQTIVPDVLEARNFPAPLSVRIAIDWLELTRVDHTELTIA